MRMFPNTAAGVIEALETSFGKGIYADKVVERILRSNKKWGSRDRSFVAEHTYEIVRNWRFLWWILDSEPSLKRKSLWDLFGVYILWKGEELPDWPKFDKVRGLDVQARLTELPDDIGIRESFPEWFNDKGTEELGAEEWAIVAHEMNQPASVILRTNSLKTTREALLNELEEAGLKVSPLPGSDIAIVLEGRPRLNSIPAFAEGRVEVQDYGSQLIAPFVNVEPGMKVIDACAGAGGKTLHMGEMMGNSGQIISMDVEERKLSELNKRAQRSGIKVVKTVPIEDRHTIRKYSQWADRLLLDVPCSGSGVIKRDPDTKWKLQPEHLERTMEIQADILRRYTDMVKPGGELVYATCSIFKSENEDQVKAFLELNPDFQFIEDKRVHPSEFNDGFYMARMVRS